MVIVLSILLAFAIDAAWDYRGDRKSETELLQSLRQEYENNKATLQRSVGAVEDDLELLGAFYAKSPDELADLPEDSAGNYWGALYRPNTLQLASGATVTALSSGNLDLIRSSRLRDLVAGWPARTEDIEERARVMVGFEQAWYDFVPTRSWGQESILGIGSADLRRSNPARLRGARGDDEALARLTMRTAAAEIYVAQMIELISRIDSTLVLLSPE